MRRYKRNIVRLIVSISICECNCIRVVRVCRIGGEGRVGGGTRTGRVGRVGCESRVTRNITRYITRQVTRYVTGEVRPNLVR